MVRKRDRDRLREKEEKERKAYELERRRRWFVTPECCQTVQDTAVICLDVSEKFHDGDLETPPKWVVRTGEAGYHTTFRVVEAKFCPFCASPMPEIEKRVTDRKIMVVTDGGYYCATCSERCNCCLCLRPSFHWQAKGAKAVIPPSPKPEKDDDDEATDD